MNVSDEALLKSRINQTDLSRIKHNVSVYGGHAGGSGRKPCKPLPGPDMGYHVQRAANGCSAGIQLPRQNYCRWSVIFDRDCKSALRPARNARLEMLASPES